MIAQVSTQIADAPGWGAAEWMALVGGVVAILGAITGLIVANKRQHDDNRNAAKESAEEIREEIRQVGHMVGKVDQKVDDVRDDLIRHESLHHRRGRRW